MVLVVLKLATIAFTCMYFQTYDRLDLIFFVINTLAAGV